MKFFMTIAVCSFLDYSCTTSMKYPVAFDTWNQCMFAAYEESIDLMKNLDQDLVQKNRLATRFICEALPMA